MSAICDPTTTNGDYVLLDGEEYCRISNSHLMPEFFMSLVGPSNHWMFISSCGAVTAGRRDPDSALFPYASDDQLSVARGHTGSTTWIRAENGWWEPFANHREAPQIRRNLYKNPLGTKVVFEEINDELRLVFRYRWAFSLRFGFVRTCHLENLGDGGRHVQLLDGIRNIVPFGLSSEFLLRFSNLANAYKRNELLPESRLGLFYLSSIPTDRAVPSEALKATIVWQAGLAPQGTLLSADQLTQVLRGLPVRQLNDVRGKAGAYISCQDFLFDKSEVMRWHHVAELDQGHADVVRWDELLRTTENISEEIEEDLNAADEAFLRIISSADAVQTGANKRRSSRHLSNTVFNVMRGGVPLQNYQIDTADFRKHIVNFNRPTGEAHLGFLESLPQRLELSALHEEILNHDDVNLTRLGLEYLPIAFSRRHGDPTRPWNRFSIDIVSEDGQTSFQYQGNWRDIFQNWEALGFSFPLLIKPMICRFLNATTADGYNPYRLTKDGFEWEAPSPDDPWANIGYWGDHQIIYLLKLLEWQQCFSRRSLDQLTNSAIFTHAQVPYRIKSFDEIKVDPRNTIEFDHELAATIADRVNEIGADGKLMLDNKGEIQHVSMVEKLLTLSLAKMTNFIPDGGIWMNTQRPEWNDANNALVGLGLSVVTACYLNRWFTFLADWMSTDGVDEFDVSVEVTELLKNVDAVLRSKEDILQKGFSGETRGELVTALSQAGSDYRQTLYQNGLSGKTTAVTREFCAAFFQRAQRFLAATIRNNQRPDGLYHSYNLIDWSQNGLEIEHLYEMLEGQVAVLSSGLLQPEEVIQLLSALRDSPLYRANQDSYLLYPDRQLPSFLQKNIVDEAQVQANPLLATLLTDESQKIVKRDIHGATHFYGRFRNSSDLREALDALDDAYQAEVVQHASDLVSLFDDIFGHRQFTGRSGTFFAYEGLGSIYWHMVSKLRLAVVENYEMAKAAGAPEDQLSKLRSFLQAIRAGIGEEKSPEEYGAFPSDPYSHTPENAGVKQPGMTGQVKEDILSRFAELGVQVEDGCVKFQPELFDKSELLDAASEMKFYALDGASQTLEVPAGGFAFTLFQVPVVYLPGEVDGIDVHFRSGQRRSYPGMVLDASTSQELFARTDTIEKIECTLKALGC